MPPELHIHIHPSTPDPEDVISAFPFEDGQSVIAQAGMIVMIDLAGADDTSTAQEWYLNGHEGVYSFYIVDDDHDEAGSEAD